jgi:hypothetical protein
MRRTKHGSGLGTWRWVVERTFAWLNQFRRLRVRYDKRADIPRSVPLARLCADLLAVVAQDVENRLSRSAFSSSHRQVAVWGVVSAAALGFPEPEPKSIDPAALQRIYCLAVRA